MREVKLKISPPARGFLRRAIRQAGGSEVYFLGRVTWDSRRDTATLDDLEVMARGNRLAVPAIIERAEEWDLAIHNHPSGDLKPSDPDISVAGELGNRGVGFAIISNDAERHYLVVPPTPREEAQPVEEEEVRRFFSREGPLAAGMQGFESRAGQLEMALEVARSLNEHKVIACEAGTGVGKSFAYLVPAILWAVRNRLRIVVSTGTIALQEQLVWKDLPFLEKVLPVDFHFSLIKGRNNYACRRKLAELPQELQIAPVKPREQELLMGLIAWGGKTPDGSLADLPAPPPPALWEKAMSETDKSLKVACPHYHQCFYYEARRRASRAHVVVANHHLFFADLSVRRESGNYEHDLILPAYSRVIFDEAHHLEDVASEHLGTRFTRAGVRMRMARMCSSDGERGTLVVLAKRLRQHGDGVAAEAIERGYVSALPEVAERLDAHFSEIDALLDEERQAAARRENGGEGAAQSTAVTVKVRFKPAARLRPFWDAVNERLDAVQRELDLISRLNDRALETLERATVPEDRLPSLRLGLTSFGGRLEGLRLSIESFRDFSDCSRARWIEAQESGRKSERGSLVFAAAPIAIADVLLESLFMPLKSVVLTSATLSVAGDPDFLGERLGFTRLPSNRFAFRSFPSPFNFRDQVRLVVPDDLPPPSMKGFEARLPEVVLDLLRASRGRAFVLFTSYSLLRRLYARLEEPIARLGWRPLAQGDAQRSELLARFRAGNCVLFGTDSFWEGVDVKGRALGCVILTRLPFRVPTEPLQEARLEDVEARGANPFTSFTVPQAVLRFKQGFGRLVRSAEDRGVVAVLDSRVLHRPYGRSFLESLPPARITRAPTNAVVEQVRRFFGEAELVPEPASPPKERPPPW